MVRRDAEMRETGVFSANRAIGKIALDIVSQAGVSRRARVREEGSLRVRFPGAASRQLEAVVINTAGGIAGGDSYTVDVTVGEDAALVLTTAAAEKVYRAIGDDAAMSLTLRAQAGAQLSWLPRETILFDRCQLKRSIEVDLAPDATFLAAEAVLFGRTGMGEEVASGRFVDRWRVRRGGELIYAETIRLDGAISRELAKTAVASSHLAYATILMSPADERFVAALRAAEMQMRGEVGVSSWNGLTLARFLARDGESLRHDMMVALNIALSGPLPRLWLN
jgi:urease accessory protein